MTHGTLNLPLCNILRPLSINHAANPTPSVLKYDPSSAITSVLDSIASTIFSIMSYPAVSARSRRSGDPNFGNLRVAGGNSMEELYHVTWRMVLVFHSIVGIHRFGGRSRAFCQ